MSVSVVIDTSDLARKITLVSRGIKGGLRKALSDSAGRVGVNLARETLPITERGVNSRKEAQIRRVYPTAGRIYECLKAWPSDIKGYGGKEPISNYRLRMAKLFMAFMKAGEMQKAVDILKAFQPFRPKVGTSANEAEFRSFSRQRTGAGSLNSKGMPKVFWNCILLPPSADGSRENLIKKMGKTSGAIANGWVVASRYFRAGRSTDHLEKFKTRKQKIVTGSGNWEKRGTTDIAVLNNTYRAAFAAMRPGAMGKAIATEERNLEKQLKNQAIFEAKKAGIGK